MIRSTLRLLALAFVLLNVSSASAQDTTVLKSKLVFYPFDMINHGLTIGYERAFRHPHWTVNAMLGYRSDENSLLYDGSVAGAYAELQFRYYFNPGGWNRRLAVYASPFLNYKYTSFGNQRLLLKAPEDVKVTNFGFLIGIRSRALNRLAFDFNLGPGLLTADRRIGRDIALDRYRSGWNLHGNFGVGFMF